MNTKGAEKLPIDRKLNLTIEEAAEYSNIGEHAIRELVKRPESAPFVLYVGRKALVKRRLFEKWVESASFL